MEKYSLEYNNLLIKAVEKFNKIDKKNCPNDEILIPIQREIKPFIKENHSTSDSFNESVIIFRYRRREKYGNVYWDLSGDNITDRKPTYL